LHHEARNDPLEDSILEVYVHAMLTCTESSEVFDRSREMILEKFHDNATLLVALLTFLADMNVHEDLNMLYVKIWHARVYTGFLASILTILENF